MDTDQLDRDLEALCHKAVASARAAVEAAPDGAWIAGSEWEVREVFQQLTRDCYQLMLQARSDGHSTAGQASFSPSAGRDASKQRRAAAARADRRG